jgi:hypothetical protein
MMKYEVDIERIVTSVVTVYVEAENFGEAKARAFAMAPVLGFPVGDKEHHILTAALAEEYG